MTSHQYDIQGRFCGLPYDFRIPTWAKIAKRLYRPGGPLLVPRVFGAGWTVNVAHPGSKWLAGVALVGALCVALAS